MNRDQGSRLFGGLLGLLVLAAGGSAEAQEEPFWGIRATTGDGIFTRPVVVDSTLPGSPAMHAGLLPRDIIRSIDGAPIEFPDDVKKVRLARGVGARLQFAVERNGRAFTVTLQSTSEPAPELSGIAWQHVYKVPIDSSPARGADTAKATVVVFSNFRCPITAQLHSTLNELVRQHGTNLRVVWKNLYAPGDPEADKAANAALAAHQQGKFWEMADRLFAAQQPIDDLALEGHARALGLDVDAWWQSYRARFEGLIKQDRKLAEALELQATPVLFINGRPLSGTHNRATLKAMVQQEMVRGDTFVQAGVPPHQIYTVATRWGRKSAGRKLGDPANYTKPTALRLSSIETVAAPSPPPAAPQVAGSGAPPVAGAGGRPPEPIGAPSSSAPLGSSPVEGALQPNAYALVIGIEKYRDVPSPTGARLDAEQMQRALKSSLGVPAQNILLALDERATRADIDKQLRWLRQNVPQNGRIYFYFSGHGAPEPSTGISYLVPYDGDPRFLADTAMQLPEVLKALSLTKARDVLAIVDSCFSGAGGRSVLPPGARPLVKVKETRAVPRVALFAASSGSEISGPAKRGGGLFTTVLLEALTGGRADGDGDGAITLEEALSWVRPRVAREAKRDNREQTPQLFLGAGAPAARDFILLQAAPR